MTAVQQPSDTIYLADYEDGCPIVIDTNSVTGWNDVWAPGHLPYTVLPGHTFINPTRRVGAKRHGEGSDLLLFDGHSGWKRASAIVIDDWRTKRY
jgi:prepilin-type processing-associated H-X9-DG protein